VAETLHQQGQSLIIPHDRRKGRAYAPGDEVLARISPKGRGRYVAKVIRALSASKTSAFGEVIKTDRGFILENADRNARHPMDLQIDSSLTVEAGDLVEVEIHQGRGYLRRTAKVIRKLGKSGGYASFSPLAIAEFELPHHFDDEVLAEAEKADLPNSDGREDLTTIPLVTIDGADAKDFDDAVYAEPHGDGWRILVAIADVSYYVPEGSALDREARLRGNSVYLPDMVIPMLPEALSNGLCSLKPDEIRGCLVADMTIDADGQKTSHRIYRGLMRSQARLTYDEVESVITTPDALPPAGLAPDLIQNLLSAWKCLDQARRHRGALELHLAEKKVQFDDQGKPIAISKRFQNTSQKIIEEMMILANVAAAETLEDKGRLCVYRAHEAPDPTRIDGLHDLCRAMGLSFAKGQVIRPKDFNHLLDRARSKLGEGDNQMLNETVLRCQSQADYRISNPGHYGLGLMKYAHFTSPIRRYSDLMVHRSLLQESQITTEDADDICQHISDTERRAARAERRSVDRYSASLMTEQSGHILAGRVTSITGFGAFIDIMDFNAEGLLPLGQMPPDYYHVDTTRGVIRGDKNGIELRTGDQIDVMILSVIPVKGSVLLSWADTGLMRENNTAKRHSSRRRSATQPRHGKKQHKKQKNQR
jgi:ribonuclease R